MRVIREEAGEASDQKTRVQAFLRHLPEDPTLIINDEMGLRLAVVLDQVLLPDPRHAEAWSLITLLCDARHLGERESWIARYKAYMAQHSGKRTLDPAKVEDLLERVYQTSLQDEKWEAMPRECEVLLGRIDQQTEERAKLRRKVEADRVVAERELRKANEELAKANKDAEELRKDPYQSSWVVKKEEWARRVQEEGALLRVVTPDQERNLTEATLLKGLGSGVMAGAMLEHLRKLKQRPAAPLPPAGPGSQQTETGPEAGDASPSKPGDQAPASQMGL